MAIAPKVQDDREATAICDNCGQFQEIEGLDEIDFFDALSLLRIFGWTSTREEEKWSHFCPDCTPKQKGQTP